MASFGYIRTSTKDQNAALQREAMARVDGLKRVYADEGLSGTLASRPEWDKLVDRLEDGDEVVVWKFDRIGRNALHVLEAVRTITERGATFRSLTEQIDTRGPMGQAMLTIMAAFSQLERDTIVERTRAGLEAAKAQGKVGGRPSVVDAKKLATIRKLVASGEYSRAEIARMVGISPATLYRVLSTL
ncbi:Site-specific DNA recombinase [Microbacterium testaceum StLB037]|uniref:Site-specific DNA recombinase n=1 Tax=Microbacterium testaceum (strain StLB037) TaxID=979556 RepID=A0A1H0P2E4_MICTS|nr:recombinase family protein [Microbacterium testaceum]SDO98865.1 Site-specific DNA recombinase [Microbacterium testaceum StLB037]